VSSSKAISLRTAWLFLRRLYHDLKPAGSKWFLES
jgi:hypothetical protein